MRYLILMALAGAILASCTPTAQKQADSINKLEKELVESSKKGVADTVRVKELLQAYKAYIQANPDDTMSAIYLLKSGKFYAATSETDKAVVCYREVYTRYPKFSRADYALFSEAFLFENEKHELGKAGQLYKKYLREYPAGAMAKSAEFELKNLGKPVEQVMEEIQKNRDTTQAQ